MFRDPKTITPLEEDLKMIGLGSLLPESAPPPSGEQQPSARERLLGKYAQYKNGKGSTSQPKQEPKSDPKQDPKPVAEDTDHAAALLEEVDNLVSSLAESEQKDIIVSFAHAAVVAETLSERFLQIAEILAEQDDADEESAKMAFELSELSQDFENLAEEAADAAEELKECADSGTFAESIDQPLLEQHFKEILESVLEGVEIYSDLTEDDDEDEEEEEEEKEKKGKKKDEEDDDEEKEKDEETKNPS